MKILLLKLWILWFFPGTWGDNLEIAKDDAQKNHKLIILYFSGSDWCGPCIKLKQEVLESENFQEFAKDVAMQVTAATPLYVKREDIPEDVKAKEKDLYKRQALDSGKPEKIIDKIAEGKMEKFYQEVCLMEQPFIKNPDITIKGLLEDLVVKIGENVIIKRFVRFQLGETAAE